MEMLENADESMENIYILDIQILHQFPESIDIDQFSTRRTIFHITAHLFENLQSKRLLVQQFKRDMKTPQI